ncbi:uncharacterized protein LOC132852281 [Tachysurus vachellii]|uniref:uncharacterized protein LOC132852281 n=1 Tax=Tachysurus vachellii TaxID=175792 RepID=UPI00296B50DF|nr:uncharacterized protein LOC132852281 [Tachysurus vachellii]
MDVKDKRCDDLFLLIEKQEQFANHLMDFAKDLEEMTKTMTKGKCVGNTATVLGSATLIGAGIAFFTAGVAIPFLATAAGAAVLTGTATSVTCTVIEIWKSNEAMKNAERIASEIEEIWKKVSEIQDLTSMSSDELGRKITETILKAVAKKAATKGAKYAAKTAVQKGANYAATKAVTEGAKTSVFLATKEGTSLALKTVLKGTSQFAGGALGIVFTLPDLIDNCQKLYEGKHETDASSCLREKAKQIHDAVKQLKEQMNNIEDMYNETSDSE